MSHNNGVTGNLTLLQILRAAQGQLPVGHSGARGGIRLGGRFGGEATARRRGSPGQRGAARARARHARDGTAAARPLHVAAHHHRHGVHAILLAAGKGE